MRLATPLLMTILFSTALPAADLDLGALERGAEVHGFRVEAIYLDAADRPFGGRFVHRATGFTLDALQIESAPQGFIWVTTFPTSDKGEPHTQEHLLLGKGNVGRAVASLESMTLTGSSAFTEQWRTCYHFNTVAGPEVYHRVLERQLDALLHPDYSDEEIRREVRNFGVSDDPASGALRLEEKGTVYNEMVSSTDRPFWRLYRAAKTAAWGAGHPLSFNSGGEPAAIREMTPQDIRRFHAATHHLDGMGMIGAYPRSMPLGDVLATTDAMLQRLHTPGLRGTAAVRSEEQLPPPRGAAPGTVEIVPYPLQNESQPSPVAVVWPAVRDLDPTDTVIFELFLANFAGDPTTNLYKRLIDSRTRTLDVGAQAVFAWTFSDQGQPFVVGLTDVQPSHIDEEGLRSIRREVVAELERIAAWEDASPELADFQQRMRSRVVELRRDLAKLVNTPPRFGFRGTGSQWMDHLHALARTPDFRRSVTLEPQLAAIEELLAGSANPWRDKLRQWKVLGAEPIVLGTRPDATALAADAEAREERIAAELARLGEHYGVEDDQEAIRRYRAEVDAVTAELEKVAAKVEAPSFLEHPPLTLDDELQWRVGKLESGVATFTATFESMTSASTSLALRLDGVADEELALLALLPTLLTEVGVIVDGKPIPYEEMREALRNEVLSLDALFATDFRTGRAELLLTGAGNDLAEARRAVVWMGRVLGAPDWRPENLDRIRDVVDQAVAALRNRMQGSEESWVNDPGNAYRRQDSALLLSTASFLTRAHHAHRLRWLLRDPGSAAEAAASAAFFATLGDAAAGTGREALEELAGALAEGAAEGGGEQFAGLFAAFEALPPGAREHAVEAGKDLQRLVADLPDGSLEGDWKYLAGQMRADLMVTPAATLGRLEALRRSLLRTGQARIVLAASTAGQKELAPALDELAAGLEKGSPKSVERRARRVVRERLAARDPKAADAFFVGLVAPQLKGGVFLQTVDGWSWADRDPEALLDFLASRLFAGGGAHGIFMKTWGAGLAYSNGFRGNLSSGLFGYYAERTPELPQTLRFVIDTVSGVETDPALVEYAIAGAFSGSRTASTYEARALGQAADLVDGLTPEMVSGVRRAVLGLRQRPDLAQELFSRMPKVYARVLPGMGASVRQAPGASFFVIGNERQLEAWEEYLKTVEGPETTVFRLYPRDFWIE